MLMRLLNLLLIEGLEPEVNKSGKRHSEIFEKTMNKPVIICIY